MSNDAFQKRVGKINGGVTILKGAGFVEEDGWLIMEKMDEKVIKETLRLIENNLE